MARKIIGYAAVIGAICWSIRFYGNQQWAKGEAQGRRYATVEIEKQKRAEWAAKEAAIASDAEALIGEKRALAAATESLRQERAQLSNSLNNALAIVAKAKERNYETAAAVPASGLDAAIRAISAELAATH
jgi:hypothetical protein